jgi:hypothetical protein
MTVESAETWNIITASASAEMSVPRLRTLRDAQKSGGTERRERLRRNPFELLRERAIVIRFESETRFALHSHFQLF